MNAKKDYQLRSEHMLRELQDKASSCYEWGNLEQASRMMEELVEYCAAVGSFQTVACLEITMTYIEQLMKAGRNDQALDLARKVFEARKKKLSLMSKETLQSYHLLPILLNRLKRYQEAVEWSTQLQKLQLYVFGYGPPLMETKAELALALYKIGKPKRAGRLISKILK